MACSGHFLINNKLQHLALGVIVGNSEQQQMHELANIVSTFPIPILPWEGWKYCCPLQADKTREE